MPFILFFLFHLASYAECHFFLSPNVVVPAGDLNLSQLGQLSCSNPNEAQTYSTLVKSLRLTILYPASPELSWKRAYIEIKWNQLNRNQPLIFAGPDMIQIKVQQASFSTEEFREMVEEEILKHLPEDQDYLIEFKNFPGAIEVPSSDYRFQFMTSRITRGHVRVKLFHENRLLRQFFLRFKVLSKQGFFRTIGPLQRGESLKPENLQLTEDYISIQEPPLSPSYLLDLPQMLMRKNVPAGSILRKGDVQYKAIIRRNQRLKGILNRGNLRIDLQVIALTDGKKNDVIEVQSVETRRKFQAKVIDSKTVELNL